MFQNIQDVYQNVEDVNNKRKINIFSNVISKNKIILYILVLMISTIGMGQELSLFSISIVGACIAAGIPIIGVALFGLIGNVITFGTSGALNYMVTLLVLIITMFILKPLYNEENRTEKMKISLNVFLSIFLVQAIKLLSSGFTIYDGLMTITLGIITTVFYKIFVNSIIVIQEYDDHNAFSIEEVMGASLMLAIAVSSLGGFSIYGFSIRNILSILIVLVLGWKNGILVGTTSGVAIGVTLGVIAETEPIMIAAYAISGMIAGILNKFGKIGVIVGFMIGSGILAYISNGWTSDLILFKEILIASIGLLAIPKNIQINIEEFLGKSNLLPVSPIGSLTRSKEKETAEKLDNVSSAIKDIANTYNNEISDDEIFVSNRNIFISELLNQLDNKQNNILYDDLTKMENNITEELFNILIKKQKIDRKDLLETFAKFNSFIVGIEDRNISEYLEKNIEEAVTCINNAYKISKANFVLQKKLTENKKTMSTQLGEVSKAISDLAKDIKQEIKSEDKFEIQKKEILTLITQLNIHLEDIRIKEEKNGRYHVDIIIATGEITNNQKEKIQKIVSNSLKQKMILCKTEESRIISFVAEDKYSINIGMARTIKKGSEISGDSILKIRLKDGKYLIAISDGMGSGVEAAKSSILATNMLQKLLSSGFDKDTSVELINSTILNSSEKEIFATLDIAIVDLYAGNIEFMKNGACPTYIKNKKKISIIKSVTLPTGIIDNVDLSLHDKDIENNDIVVMCSDGIIDSNVEYKNKELWIKYMLEDIETEDSQKIADLLLNEAIDNNYGVAKDDMSVIVCKFVKK
ncbi:MAG: SpoIIE family protein phosphatase [Clostridia bacterium]|nr:SpoIIE family protein phosphatase [Clostridia bacterium]